MRIAIIGTAVFLAGCGSVSPTTSSHPRSTPQASSSAAAVRFLTPDPAQLKIVGAQSGADPFSASVGFHEIGMPAGAPVDYRVTGTASIEYQCMATNGSLNGAPGTNQTVTASVRAEHRFMASASGDVQGVIVVPPPAPANAACPAGYSAQAWRSAYSGMLVTDLTHQVNWQAPDQGGEA